MLELFFHSYPRPKKQMTKKEYILNILSYIYIYIYIMSP